MLTEDTEVRRRIKGRSRRSKTDVVSNGSGVLICGRGQYSDAVLDELESQNDSQVEGILGKVQLLKNVRRRETLHASLPD